MPNQLQEYDLFAGSYNAATEEGIHRLRFNAVTGTLAKTGGLAGIENPSFLAFDAQQGRLYAVSEKEDNGEVVAISMDAETGELTLLNRQPTNGGAPCHLAIDPSGQWLTLVNYLGGSVCVYPIAFDGAIGTMVQQIAHQGSSIHADRQEAPHPHAIYSVPGTTLYLVNDLGTDTIHTYRLNHSIGKLVSIRETKVHAGAGPRHLAIHPSRPYVYLIEELTSTITVFELDAAEGSLKRHQTVSTLPPTFTGENTCAEIAISEDGNYLYGSNRGHNSIAAYKINTDGGLEQLGHTLTGGHTPRHFLLVPGGEWLLAANQDSNSITVLKIDADGYPHPTDRAYAMHKPVCIRLG